MKKAISVTKTIYPIDYELNNKYNDQSFNNWHIYIRDELNEISAMNKMIIEAKKIINRREK